MSRYEFSLELTADVVCDSDDSRIKKLRLACDELGYFGAKRNVDWTTVRKIGIVSKQGTQGYNDFVKQFGAKMTVRLAEIVLEGAGTEESLIGAIESFADPEEPDNRVDVIIIIRGGGSTVDMSNSFDTMPIFKAIRESITPVVTAIGHEADKGDKLLITCISDVDFSTPSTAAIDITKICMDPILKTVRARILEIGGAFRNIIDKKVEDKYEMFSDWFDGFKRELFGGPVVSVNGKDAYVIVHRSGEFFKIKICDADKIDTAQSQKNSTNMEYAQNVGAGVSDNDTASIRENMSFLISMNIDVFNKRQVGQFNATLLAIEKDEATYARFGDCVAKKTNAMYCVPYVLSTSPSQLTKLYEMYLWYANELHTGGECAGDVFEFIRAAPSSSAP